MSGLHLVPATDAHFAWLLAEVDAPDGLRVPPGGLDEPWVFKWLRRTLPTLGGYGSWLMVVDEEIVGLCSYKRPPNAAGDVETGYGIAPQRRRLGYATQGVALLIEAARRDARVRAITAETALANLASQKVLAANGFADVGRNTDDDEGEVIVWRLELMPSPASLWLAPTSDAHFAWMLGQAEAPEPLRVAPGGVDSPYGLAWNRDLVAAGGPTWLIVDGDEIVGLFCRKGPPNDGVVEIGYRVGEARRGRGYASGALRLAIAAAKAEPDLRKFIAETVPANIASHRVLEHNGFAQTGRRIDPGDGELICWARDVGEASESG